MRTHKRKIPFLAIVLSGIMPGLGQFYNGHWLKGSGFLITGIGGFVVTSVEMANQGVDLQSLALGLQPPAPGKLLAFSLAVFAIVFVSILDAYISARRINRMS